MYTCVPSACLVTAEVRREHQIPETGLVDCCEPPCGWILGIQHEVSAEAAIGLNLLAIAPFLLFLDIFLFPILQIPRNTNAVISCKSASHL